MSLQEHHFQTELTHNVNLPYLLFKPSTPAPHPLIIYLHGVGERGSDLSLLDGYGPNTYALKQPDFPFMVVSPQCPAESFWNIEVHALEAMLSFMLQQYDIDPTRVYLTGNSMGGYGTWNWAVGKASLFAAIAPICGGGIPWMTRFMADLPVWAFHGDADEAVDIGESVRMVEAVKHNGGDAKLTVYPGVAHDSWTQTYLNPDLYTWFLSHQRS